MIKLKLDLENCYGIRKLSHTFDFSQKRSFVLYAPNGTMKSSMAATFSDLANGSATTDRMYPNRVTKREILDEASVSLDPASVFVIEPYNEAFQTKQTATLLVNAALRKEYEVLHEKVSVAQEKLTEALRKQAKTKRDVEAELQAAYGEGSDPILRTLQKVRARLQVEVRNTPLKDIEYDMIFDDRIVAVIAEQPVQTAISDYIKRYNELLAASPYFSKGVFTFFDGGEVAKTLSSHGFFKAGHEVILHGDRNTSVTKEKDLEAIIQAEKDRLLSDPAIKKQFEAVEKALKKNAQLRAFESYLSNHPEILPLLASIPEAKRLVWKSYIFEHYELLNDLVSKYEAAEKRRREIEAQAAREKTRWEAVVSIFNDRFSVPFTLSVSNKAEASLGVGAPTLQFTFDDKVEKVATNRDNLVTTLSQGEKKALYILNLIFDVEARIESGIETLFVVDDIADSFDYRNKYAIVQYLQDIQDVPHFRLLILTHNFDFYRTLESRFVKREHCLMAVKTLTEVTLEKAVGIRNIFTNLWKRGFFTEIKQRIACIPFQRNLIEYTKGEKDTSYKRLTSLLHWQADTPNIKQSELDAMFNAQFGMAGSWAGPDNPIVDDIFSAAVGCLSEPEGLNFENKIVLSIAIRLAAERFMVTKINDMTFVGAIASNQTPILVERFGALFPMDDTAMSVLRKVLLMTPESIHLNSFMYEPILDMSDAHLRGLYREVCALS